MTNFKKPIPKKSLRLKSKKPAIKNFPNDPRQKQNPFKSEWDFSKPDSFEYHASCPDGLSGLLREEILEAGLKIISENRGGVFFQGLAHTLKEFALSTGISSGISISLKHWKVENPEDLYDQAVQFPFEKILGPEHSFRIDSTTKDSLKDSRYATYKLKDAIFDRFRSQGKEPPKVSRDEPDFLFYLRSHSDHAKLSLGLNTRPLQQRGHGRIGGPAPMREILASALVRYSGWNTKSSLYDPFCGSGTIVVEAALKLLYSGYTNYRSLTASLPFKKLFGETNLNVKNYSEVKIFASDKNETTLNLARQNAKNAGVDHLITFFESDATVSENEKKISGGFIVTNPPYGVRIGTKEEAKEIYVVWGKKLKDHFAGNILALACGDTSLLGFLKLKKDKEQSLTIGKLEGKLVAYTLGK
ncbi:THUMP domain-containing class I SAM-dependent RNA methyltransferase [Leptospira mayottensis]|uniref:THUMP domain-containing class I SAM-dependent RNA methyltransferase n=1 Tax=Leptospira mayottensis TaxID=1137606 RepID=UPI0002BEC667|nr:N-6 DNA methylase [Leptospira mayottensis]AXR60957.1 RNA methyltransferase [Leptospira mayottensis]AZQ02609.1 RNA methyltransferase [Leptospira mayottensis 200901116]TGN02322.1 RNA methyltransferase [Leptospira mayottensis]